MSKWNLKRNPLLPRRCRRCGRRSRQVEQWLAPISNYLECLTWRCIDEDGCKQRRRV